MASHAHAHFPPTAPFFKRVDIVEPTVAMALRPVITRALIGDDRDCLELAIYLGTDEVRPAIVTNGCKESTLAGVACIVPTLLADWDERLCFPLTRCVHCVLHNRTCDLLATILHLLIPCPCEWLIPPADHRAVDKRNRMVVARHQQMALPFKKRLGGEEYLEFMRTVNDLDAWFLQRIRSAHTADIGDLQAALDADDEFVGPNWVVPPTHQWHVCPCFPDHCDISNHPVIGPLAVYDADSESCEDGDDDGETDYSGHSGCSHGHSHGHCGPHGHLAAPETEEASAEGSAEGSAEASPAEAAHDTAHDGNDSVRTHVGTPERKVETPSLASASTASLVDVADMSVALNRLIDEGKAALATPVAEGQCCGQW
ncbi:hypothetical protein Q8F55_000465 [Vanrija albida]|uniref:Uncharacterized protein n=1 Tax=Vanrija albida TaxID=181172 RepID=A0ABR3QDC0_9TREE